MGIRPYLTKQRTVMREPLSVETQVAVTLCYLSDERCYRKVVMHLEYQYQLFQLFCGESAMSLQGF